MGTWAELSGLSGKFLPILDSLTINRFVKSVNIPYLILFRIYCSTASKKLPTISLNRNGLLSPTKPRTLFRDCW